MATTNDSSTFLVGKRFPNRLFVGGLPPNTEAVELAQYFSQYGLVTDAKVIADEKNISKGYGFVTFKSTADVKNVVQCGTLFFKDKKINIGPAVKKDGPMIQPEVVIVPKAPSKGTYFYPEPTPQYIAIEPVPVPEPCYVQEPCFVPELPCYSQCYVPETCYAPDTCFAPKACYGPETCYAPESCYAPDTCLGYYPYQICHPMVAQQCYQPVGTPVVQAPVPATTTTASTKRRRRALPPRFKRSS